MNGFERILVVTESTGGDPHLEQAAEAVRSQNPPSKILVVHSNRPTRDRKGILDDILSEAVAFHADLVVMGGHSHVLASRAAMVSPCSILMVPVDQQLSLRNVLVAIDFSDHSRNALYAAAALCRLGDGELVCVSVETEDAPWHFLRSEDLIHLSRQEAVEKFVFDALGYGTPVTCLSEPLDRSAAVLSGSPLSLAHSIQGADVASTIDKVADRINAGLTVVGTRGRSRSAAVLLGSIPEKLIQFSKRPILTTRLPGSELGLIDILMGRGQISVP